MILHKNITRRALVLQIVHLFLRAAVSERESSPAVLAEIADVARVVELGGPADEGRFLETCGHALNAVADILENEVVIVDQLHSDDALEGPLLLAFEFCIENHGHHLPTPNKLTNMQFVSKLFNAD